MYEIALLTNSAAVRHFSRDTSAVVPCSSGTNRTRDDRSRVRGTMTIVQNPDRRTVEIPRLKIKSLQSCQEDSARFPELIGVAGNEYCFERLGEFNRRT